MSPLEMRNLLQTEAAIPVVRAGNGILLPVQNLIIYVSGPKFSFNAGGGLFPLFKKRRTYSRSQHGKPDGAMLLCEPAGILSKSTRQHCDLGDQQLFGKTAASVIQQEPTTLILQLAQLGQLDKHGQLLQGESRIRWNASISDSLRK